MNIEFKNVDDVRCATVHELYKAYKLYNEGKINYSEEIVRVITEELIFAEMVWG